MFSFLHLKRPRCKIMIEICFSCSACLLPTYSLHMSNVYLNEDYTITAFLLFLNTSFFSLLKNTSCIVRLLHGAHPNTPHLNTFFITRFFLKYIFSSNYFIFKTFLFTFTFRYDDACYYANTIRGSLTVAAPVYFFAPTYYSKWKLFTCHLFFSLRCVFVKEQLQCCVQVLRIESMSHADIQMNCQPEHHFITG